MSESASRAGTAASPPSTGGIRQGLARAGQWIAQRFARLDKWVNKKGRNWAQAVPAQLLPLIVLIMGSTLIALVAWPGAAIIRMFHFIDCGLPAIGPWLALSCAAAPAARNVPMVLVGIMLLWIVIWFLGRLFVTFSSKILQSELLRVEEPDIPCKVLVMGLSPARPAEAIQEAEQWRTDWALYAGPAKPWKEKSGTNAPAKAGGWQQGARMIAAHLSKDTRTKPDTLKKIYVLPSYETRALFDDFRTYVGTLFGRNINIEIVKTESGAEYEDVHTSDPRERRSYDNYIYLRDGLRCAVEMAERDFRPTRDDERPLLDTDICVDATAGFKLFSIAAAVVTLDRNILLGYVISGGGAVENPEEGVVKLFDPRLDFIGAAGTRITQSYVQSA